MKIAALTAVLLAILGVAAYATLKAWRGVGLELTLHGWVALILGVVVSIALGVGLMSLTFISARRGFDDRQDDRSDRPEGPSTRLEK